MSRDLVSLPRILFHGPPLKQFVYHSLKLLISWPLGEPHHKSGRTARWVWGAVERAGRSAGGQVAVTLLAADLDHPRGAAALRDALLRHVAPGSRIIHDSGDIFWEPFASDYILLKLGYPDYCWITVGLVSDWSLISSTLTRMGFGFVVG
jgi:hypothetical protein